MTAATSADASLFTPGTFAPGAGTARLTRTLMNLSWLEFKLFVRNGEQLAVNIVIPVSALLALTLLPLGHIGADRPAAVVPAVMASAIISSAFTGQSIAVAFDRRYGALKCVGATIAPRWAIIVGKSIAVNIATAGQLAILGTVGFAVGWTPGTAQLTGMALVAALGAACFSALGLLLGGSLRAEIVLPLANILWFAQLGICVVATSHPMSEIFAVAVKYSPAGAITTGLQAGGAPLPMVVLAAWGAVAGWLARRTFRFT